MTAAKPTHRIAGVSAPITAGPRSNRTRRKGAAYLALAVTTACLSTGCGPATTPAAGPTTTSATAEHTASSTPSAVTTTPVTTTPTPTTPFASPPPQPPTTEATRSVALMPAVVCMNLQDAQNTIQKAGVFFSRSQDATGAGRKQILDRNWLVVAQTPTPGTPVTEGEAVLSVVKYGEPNSC